MGGVDTFCMMRLLNNREVVIPVKTGIQYLCGKWIPAEVYPERSRRAKMTEKIEFIRSLMILNKQE